MRFVAFNPNFHARQFKKNDSATAAGISEVDLKRVSDGMIAYFSGRTDDLQIYVTFMGKTEQSAFYDADELSHMRDAKQVFTAVRILTVVLLVLGAILIAVNCILLKGIGKLPFGMIVGAAVFLGLFAVIGLMAAINFDGMFTTFHHIFFPQGNWQFSYWDSPMIRILPESLFFEAAIWILGCGLAFAMIILVAGIVLILRKKSVVIKTQTCI